jgi:hypothetical protein
MKRAAACLIGLCAVWPGIAVSAEKLFDVGQLAGSIATDLAVDRNDKRMARSLRSVRLTERVSAETIAQLAKTGAGPETLSALEVLEARSAGLPAPPQEALTAAPAPSASEQQEISARMRRYVAGYLARFPDFIATKAVRQFHNFDAFGAYDIHQTDQRLVISDDRWYAAFAYTTEGAHAGGHEYHKKTAAGTPMSTGECGGMLADVFDPDRTVQFEWQRWQVVNKSRLAVFGYQIGSEVSGYGVCCRKRGQECIKVGHRGFIFADPQSGEVVRLILYATSLTEAMEVNAAGHVEVGYRDHHKYNADAVINFTEDEEGRGTAAPKP